MKSALLILLTTLFAACHSQVKKTGTAEVKRPAEPSVGAQIGDYVVTTFQDRQGNLWFGTLAKGVAKYDGSKLVYLRMEYGLPSNRVGIVFEDDAGMLWFGTDAGLSKFDGQTFTHFSEADGLCSNLVSHVLIDRTGNFWIGTWGGVCRFDGTSFVDFPLPDPEVETAINPDTKDWITAMLEDSEGNIWFGRDGYGALRFDGTSFVHFTKQDGLNSNHVQSIVEDKAGNIWIGTRVAERDLPDPDQRFGPGGLNKYDGEKFSHFPEVEGLSEADVYSLYLDDSEELWVSTTSHGVYRYTNGEFINYPVPASTMSFGKDDQGTVWFGCAGGLYKMAKEGEVINVTTHGPWR